MLSTITSYGIGKMDVLKSNGRKGLILSNTVAMSVMLPGPLTSISSSSL